MNEINAIYSITSAVSVIFSISLNNLLRILLPKGLLLVQIFPIHFLLSIKYQNYPSQNIYLSEFYNSEFLWKNKN